MSCSINVVQEDKLAKIFIKGHLDTNAAPELASELKKLLQHPIEKIVFMLEELEYIASAGLRAVVFAKQKLGVDSRVYVIGANDEVKDVINMTGFDNFLIIQDTFEE